LTYVITEWRLGNIS